MKEFFRKIAGKTPKSFEDVNFMRTRRIVVPNGKYPLDIEFVAERDKSGHWKISDIIANESNVSTDLLRLRTSLTQKAFLKHLGKTSKDTKMNFDEAFLILREMEDTYLALSGAPAGEEPANHFMAAYRLMPPQFSAGLDQLYKMRRDKEPRPDRPFDKDYGL